MKRLRPRKGLVTALLAVTCTLGATSTAHAGQGDRSELLRKALENLPHASTRCGALVVDLDNGKTIYSLAADAPMIPASNQKLVVLSAAMDILGPDWSFRTRLAVRGKDLVIIGDGDPGLGDQAIAGEKDEAPTAFLDSWAVALGQAGLTTIEGDLLVDATVLDNEVVHPDWSAGDRLKWYGAPIGGLNFNDNCVELTVRPSSVAGDPAEWSLYPPCSLATIVNKARTVPLSAKATPMVGRQPDRFELVLSGRVSKEGTLQSIPVVQPNQFSATVIREQLEARGITINGQIVFERIRDASGSIPDDCRIIAERETPLPEVLHRIGRDSQNMFAECLFKRLGYEWALRRGESEAVGSWHSGRVAITPLLVKTGCNVREMAVADASGLSRDNRISAADIVSLLQYMYNHKGRDVFMESLAGNRTGGSLGKRVEDIEGDVYAKTGYIRGVRTLSGYVRTKSGHCFAFSVLFNGFPGSSGPYNKIHNRVCRILAHEESEPGK